MKNSLKQEFQSLIWDKSIFTKPTVLEYGPEKIKLKNYTRDYLWSQVVSSLDNIVMTVPCPSAVNWRTA